MKSRRSRRARGVRPLAFLRRQRDVLGRERVRTARVALNQDAAPGVAAAHAVGHERRDPVSCAGGRVMSPPAGPCPCGGCGTADAWPPGESTASAAHSASRACNGDDLPVVLDAAQHVVVAVEIERADDDRHVQRVLDHGAHAPIARLPAAWVELVVQLLDLLRGRGRRSEPRPAWPGSAVPVPRSARRWRGLRPARRRRVPAACAARRPRRCRGPASPAPRRRAVSRVTRPSAISRSMALRTGVRLTDISAAMCSSRSRSPGRKEPAIRRRRSPRIRDRWRWTW